MRLGGHAPGAAAFSAGVARGFPEEPRASPLFGMRFAQLPHPRRPRGSQHCRAGRVPGATRVSKPGGQRSGAAKQTADRVIAISCKRARQCH